MPDPGLSPSLEQRRTPRPLISRRLPSARGATEQLNATGDGDVPLTGMFWLLVGLTGVASGLLGAAMMVLLHAVEAVAFGGGAHRFQTAVEAMSALRRIVVLVLAGLVGGIGWFLLRRLTPGESTHVDDEVWTGTGPNSSSEPGRHWGGRRRPSCSGRRRAAYLRGGGD
jgi:hypothetical protein